MGSHHEIGESLGLSGHQGRIHVGEDGAQPREETVEIGPVEENMCQPHVCIHSKMPVDGTATLENSWTVCYKVKTTHTV